MLYGAACFGKNRRAQAAHWAGEDVPLAEEPRLGQFLPAARIADKVLNESIVMTNWNGGNQSGIVSESAVDYRWTLNQQGWTENDFQLLTAKVTFSAQGKDYSVKVSTLATMDVQTPGQSMTVQ